MCSRASAPGKWFQGVQISERFATQTEILSCTINIWEDDFRMPADSLESGQGFCCVSRLAEDVHLCLLCCFGISYHHESLTWQLAATGNNALFQEPELVSGTAFSFGSSQGGCLSVQSKNMLSHMLEVGSTELPGRAGEGEVEHMEEWTSMLVFWREVFLRKHCHPKGQLKYSRLVSTSAYVFQKRI